MAPTPLNKQATVTSNTSALTAATSLEKNTVLEQLLAAHPELIEEAEDLASGLVAWVRQAGILRLSPGSS